MKNMDAVAGGLLVIAGLNCGLIALFQYDLVGATLGAGLGPVALGRLFLGLVGVAAVYRLVSILHPAPLAAH
jgi:uncharacterized membrane protein YuzA (DUF378 family)